MSEPQFQRGTFHLFRGLNSAHACRHIDGSLTVFVTDDYGDRFRSKTVLIGEPDYGVAAEAYKLVRAYATEESL